MSIWLPTINNSCYLWSKIWNNFCLLEEIYRFRITSCAVPIPFVKDNQIFSETPRCVLVFFNYPMRTMTQCEVSCLQESLRHSPCNYHNTNQGTCTRQTQEEKKKTEWVNKQVSKFRKKDNNVPWQDATPSVWDRSGNLWSSCLLPETI